MVIFRALCLLCGILGLPLHAQVSVGSPTSERQTGEPGSVRLPGDVYMDFVWIGPGTFTMGAPASEEGHERDETPQHTVTISRGFYLSKYELTQGQWKAVMGTAPWAGIEYIKEADECPATYISWNDVRALVAEMTAVVEGATFRMPTEAEWEYACRAGTTTRWSFGDPLDELGKYAWYSGNSYDAGEPYPHAVGTKLPNPWGLHDMHGNVYEWCQDYYSTSSYTASTQVDPIWVAESLNRVIRGGGIRFFWHDTRSSNRSMAQPGHATYWIGARIVMDVSQRTGVSQRGWGQVKLDTR